MDKKLNIKLRAIKKGVASGIKMDFTPNFSEIFKKASTFLPISNPNQMLEFKEEKSQKIINNQNDYIQLVKEFKNGETIKFHLSIVDKNKDKEDQLFQFEKLKNDIQTSVQNKIKEIEPSLCETIYESIKTQLTEELANSKINNELTNCLKCNICGNEIKGIRYKCSVCENFNICTKCEASNIHEFNHILVKLRTPVKNENELNQKLAEKNLKYKNHNLNYELEIKDWNQISENKICLVVMLTNKGKDNILGGWSLKWLEGSDLKGNDYIDKNKFEIKQDGSTIIELNLNGKQSDKENKVYYQLFNSENEAIGNIALLEFGNK